MKLLPHGNENKAQAGSSSGNGWKHTVLLSITALGVVYGDIGTSPLYAVRNCFFGRYRLEPTAGNVLGILSLIAWSLILVISIKYLAFVLRADNDKEGGILALMELVKRPSRGFSRKLILVLGLFGAALLYGDGIITPAISVLSAVEGLTVATSAFRPFVLPVTVLILAGLFLIQRLGTGSIGKLFGPVMLLWFCVLAASGIAAIGKHPSVLAAIHPSYGMMFFREHGLGGLGILGIVFLAVTGGEALYADIGHFGVRPIRVGWYGFALPSLLLNYFGQGAEILARSGKLSNPFYQMMPSWALYPMVALAACATVIASQAVISGVFSLTFQGYQLGYLPRLNTRHTSIAQRGQIYIPVANWTLLVLTIGLVLGFRHSGNLAAAYGVAISTTMVITSLLFFIAMRKIFQWPLWAAIGLSAVFLAVDLSFFAAVMGKLMAGGWFPLFIAAVVFIMMETWRKGFVAEHRKSRNRILPIRHFLQEIGGGGKYRRVPGQAVYLTSNARGTPHSLRHNLRHNRALHNTVIFYTANFLKSPHVPDSKRLKIQKIRSDITRVSAYYGYMETADVPRDLAEADRTDSLGLDLDKITYFIGGEILLAKSQIGMSHWRSLLYTLMARNEMRSTRYFNLPPSQVFEIGIQIQV